MNIRITPHVVDRYIEHVRPGLDYGTAHGELDMHVCAAIIRQGGTLRDRPDWVPPSREKPGVGFLLLHGDQVALPVRRGCALTCLVRGRAGANVTVIERPRAAGTAGAMTQGETP